MVASKKQGLSIIVSVKSLFLLLAYVVRSSTVPVTVSRLQSLCSGSRPSETNPLSLTDSHLNPEADTVVADRLWVHSREVVLDAVSLRNKYAVGRIQSSEILQTLDNSSVPQFPSTDVLNQQTPFLTHLLVDFERVTAAIGLVESVKQDEQDSLFSPNYNGDLEILELKMYSFFCHLFYAIESRTNGTILPVVGPSLQTPENVAERFKRDYKILKDVVQLFRAISVDYELHRQTGSVEVVVNRAVLTDKRVTNQNKST